MFGDTFCSKNRHSLDYLAVSLFGTMSKMGTMTKSENWVGYVHAPEKKLNWYCVLLMFSKTLEIMIQLILFALLNLYFVYWSCSMVYWSIYQTKQMFMEQHWQLAPEEEFLDKVKDLLLANIHYGRPVVFHNFTKMDLVYIYYNMTFQDKEAFRIDIFRQGLKPRFQSVYKYIQ